jgi:HEAT repeat protein
VPALRAALKGPDGFDRLRAAEALLAIDPDKAEQALPALVMAAASDDPDMVVYAARLAPQLGPAAAQVGSPLAVALHHPDVHVRLAAADALVRIDRKNVPAVLPVLANALSTHRANESESALTTLTLIGPDARAAAPQLLAALAADFSEPPDEGYCSPQLVQALVSIGAGADAVPLLVQMLGDPEEERREAALEALTLIGKDAWAAIPALRAAVKGRFGDIHGSAKAVFFRVTGEELPDGDPGP